MSDPFDQENSNLQQAGAADLLKTELLSTRGLTSTHFVLFYYMLLMMSHVSDTQMFIISVREISTCQQVPHPLLSVWFGFMSFAP